MDPSVARPEDWVPVERRWLGLDRRTIPPALVVIGLWLVLAIVPTALNQAVDYDDQVVAGDVMQVGNDVTFVPTPGWGIEAGLRSSDATSTGAYPSDVRVVDGDVSLSVETAPFDGGPEALLDVIRETTDALNDEAGFHVVGDPVPFQTAAGDVGVIAKYEATGTKGLIAALVFDGLGVEVIATGPEDTPTETVEDIARMIGSISYQGGESA